LLKTQRKWKESIKSLIFSSVSPIFPKLSFTSYWFVHSFAIFVGDAAYF